MGNGTDILNIPLACPKCGGKMYSVRYDSIIKVLKHRSWQVCHDCKYQRDSEEFKNSLFVQ